VRDQLEPLEVGPWATARFVQVREEVAQPPPHRRALEPGRDQRLEEGLRRLVLLVHVGERRLEDVGCLARAARHEVQHRRPVQRAQARGPTGLGRALQVVGGAGIAGMCGRQAELEEGLAELVALGALRHGPLQVADGG